LFAFGEACWSVECARGERERSAGSCCLHICHFEQQSQQPRKQTNRQHKKEIFKRHEFFFVIFMMQAHEHSLREELAYQINWRIDPAAAEIDADMRARPLSFISRKYPASALMASLFFCYMYTRFLRLCVGRRNPILLSSHIWFINMRADKFIAAA